MIRRARTGSGACPVVERDGGALLLDEQPVGPAESLVDGLAQLAGRGDVGQELLVERHGELLCPDARAG